MAHKMIISHFASIEVEYFYPRPADEIEEILIQFVTENEFKNIIVIANEIGVKRSCKIEAHQLVRKITTELRCNNFTYKVRWC